MVKPSTLVSALQSECIRAGYNTSSFLLKVFAHTLSCLFVLFPDGVAWKHKGGRHSSFALKIE